MENTSLSHYNITPNLSLDESVNVENSSSVFYVDLPSTSNFMEKQPAESLGDNESYGSMSDISDLGLHRLNFDENGKKYVKQTSKSSRPSMTNLRIFLDEPDSNFSTKNIPNMTQKNFFALWTTLLEIVQKSDRDIQQACKLIRNHLKIIFVIFNSLSFLT